MLTYKRRSIKIALCRESSLGLCTKVFKTLYSFPFGPQSILLLYRNNHGYDRLYCKVIYHKIINDDKKPLMLNNGGG